ncbi:MAG: nickel pincer cofactor biosynthesis protein LarC [Bacteroidales bacterium]|nr:nickel pincer cofactor biosynthesis protein LarC [Bacteroidales bacterium]
MKILYYDCFSGISGDMNLAALIGLGVEPDYLRSQLSKLGLEGYSIRVSRDVRHSISGTRVDVILNHSHDHPHDREEVHSHGHSHEHVHRNLEDIRKIVESSALNGTVKESSMKMFRLIAEAEAKVHGTTVDQIHFHEVGAVDSIVDIVGAAICLDYLKVDRVVSSPVQLGGGFVECAHGKMPVPAPATLEILRDIPVKTGAVDKETTTPTGAAILAANVDIFTDNHQMQVEQVGYGIGHRDLAIPNILRVYLGRAGEEQFAGGYQKHQAMQLTCNIDDMNPEHYDHVIEQLFEAGADEVYITPVVMKKNRPASLLSVLCKPELHEGISRLLLTQTTTLGLRTMRLEKTELERQMKTQTTRHGAVRIKIAFLDGKAIKYKPEYEDCKRIAREQGLNLQQVCRHIQQDIDSDN